MIGHGIGLTVHFRLLFHDVGLGLVGVVGVELDPVDGFVLFIHSHHCGLHAAPVPLQDHLSVPSHFSPRFGS